jgi:uncharacterized protein CbrC (UPF0167 family)
MWLFSHALSVLVCGLSCSFFGKYGVNEVFETRYVLAGFQNKVDSFSSLFWINMRLEVCIKFLKFTVGD